MTITYQQERFADVIDDVKALAPAQWAEMAHGYENFVAEPNWKLYLSIEAAGAGLLVTARDDGKMVGYMGFMVFPHASARECLAASSTPFYVVPGPRCGLVLRRLLLTARALLAKRGVKIVSVRTHVWASAGPLLEAMGFRQTDLMYMQELDHA